jgi:glycosyltransferase involved in cell wall biosynthesis
LDFHVVTLDLDEWDGYREEIVDNVTIHHFGKPRLMNFQLPPRLKSWLRSSVSKEALFHLHGVFNPPNYSWARELTHLDYKYIYTPQDSYSPPSLRKKYWLKRLYIQLCEKLILNNAKSVQAVTDQGLIDIGKYTQNRIRLIPHFVMRFNAEMPPLDERKHICFVGRLDILQKGVDLMLEAYHHLKLIMDNPPQFILVGPEFEGSMPELKRICSKLGLKEGDEIIFAGRVSEDEKKRILNQSRVYLQLSRFEGFGMSTVEALSLGVPVIITEHIPIHKSIQNHHGGYTVRDIQ